MKFANYDDLLKVKKESLDKALDAARLLCFDAINLSFEFSSSTSGMYPKWIVSISPRCTVNNIRLNPVGSGNDLNEALENFAKACLDTSDNKGIL